jgi:alkylation response protein AidB-like acyl-CoA dehydrogenase
MDLSYSPGYETFREEVRAFCREFGGRAPRAFGFNEDTRAWQRLLIEHGYAARTIPKQYGGFGGTADILKSRIIAEEFIAGGLPMGMANQGISMLVPTLLELGTEEQKQCWIAPTLRGETIWCQGYSEPGAGSDLASISTRAVEDGDDFVINGQKIWTSTAAQADMIFCLVRTEPDKPKHEGISYLLFSMKTPGIEVRPLVTMTGRAEFNEVFFTDVRVSKKDIVGARGQGWLVANATLKHERGMLGDPNQAGTRFKALVEMMQGETLDGRRLMDHPVWRDRLLKLQARVMAMEYHGLRLLTCAQKGEDPGLARLIVKLQGCEINHQLAGFANDILGELGILYGASAHLRAHGEWQSRFMFDLGLIIGGGTAQIQKNIISERGLGMPREPKAVS